MTGGGVQKSGKGPEEVDKFIQDFGEGGDRHPDLCNILQGGCSGKTLFWIRYLGDDPQDWAEPRGVSPQSGLLSSGDVAAV